ncbi:MAG TPA: FAD/NAD(P)-binding protein [Gammaproteobacteria bacterium]
MRRRHHIAIIGGGFSGTALAVHLLRLGDSRLEISLIEARERLGRGIAYDASLDEHVLNTRASQMSMLPDDPGHFVAWLRRNGEPATGAEFVSRRRYGDYVEQTLLDALDEAGRYGQVFRAHTRTRAVDVAPLGDGFVVELDNGSRLLAQSVVLALGHPRPADPLSEGLNRWTPRYLRDPWQKNLTAGVGPDDRVLILGTGLTMVDAVLTLLRGGHRGPIHALSRNGLLPRPHDARVDVLPAAQRQRLAAAVRGADLRKLARVIRAAVEEAARDGIGWQAVLDVLRSDVPEIWRALPDDARARFVRRLRPFWEVHRHRIAPEPARTIARLIEQGRLEIRAGRVVEACANDAGIDVTQALRKESVPRTERYDWVVNCTGPSYHPTSRPPLERRLVERGLLRGDRLGLGYVTSASGAVIGKGGLVPGLYMLGPGCRPVAWETTSVPELRDHAEALAARIVQQRRDAWHPQRRRA